MKRKSLAELQKLHAELVTELAVLKKAIDAMKRKNLADLEKLHDEMVKDLRVLKRAIDGLKAAERKLKRTKKQFTVLLESRKKVVRPQFRRQGQPPIIA